MSSPQADAALMACGNGELAPNLALMHLILASASKAEAEAALRAAVADAPATAKPNLAAALELWQETPGAFAVVKAAARCGQPDDATVAHWKRAYDAAASVSPEAAVALYSLGRSDILEAASSEIVDDLTHRGLVFPGASVLEIGCGIGRLLPALAERAGEVVGLEISPAMLAEARRRCARCANVLLVQGSGENLAALADSGFDLVLAVDSFPYLVASGAHLAGGHIGEAARVLKPGGTLVIINYSYRGDDDLDRRDVARLAHARGLEVRRNGRRAFKLWDGLAFELVKPA